MIKKGYTMKLLTTTACSVLAIICQAATAQIAKAQDQSQASSGLEEVVVTAQKREQKMQEVPISITALSATQLQTRGITELADLAIATPGLNISQSSSGAMLPFLRGVGSTSNTVGSEGSIATYIDGVYVARVDAGLFSLNNLDRVEVLKGPQGTLFGRNASGGVIQLITHDPSFETSAKGSVSYESYNTTEAALYATAGLSDQVAIDFAASGRKQVDGYGENVITGHRASFTDDYTLKSKVLFEPSDDTRFVLNNLYSYSKVGGLGNTYPGTTQGYVSPPFGQILPYGFYDQRGNLEGYNYARMWMTSLRGEHEFDDFAKLTSISAYVHDQEYYHGEGDFTERSDLAPTLMDHVSQFSQEFQLSSLQSTPLDWIAGLFYYNNISAYDHGSFTGYGGGGPFDFDTYGKQRSVSYAGYGQATYEILPGLKVTGGLRYTRDEIRASGFATFRTPEPLFLFPPSNASTTANKLTWKAAVDYELAQDVLAYVSVSKGFKSGQYAILFFAPGATPTRPEILTAYEGGFKTNWFDKRLRLNVSGFHYDIDSPQVQLIQEGALIQSNAGAEKIDGAEFDGEALVTEDLAVHFSGTYLDAEYTNYPNAPSSPPIYRLPFGTGPTIEINAAGNMPPLTAKFSYVIGFDYSIDTSIGGFKLSADYAHTSGFFWEQDNFLSQHAMGILNARIRYTPTDDIGISLWGKNLTGEEYATSALSLQGPTGYPYIAAPPRVIGGTIDFKFSPAQAPAEPAAAYTPPPVVAPAAPHSYLVFFDFNKSDLTPQATQIVDQAAANAETAKVTQLTVTGHTDTVGSDAYNMRLSRRRAESVAAELEKKGIPSSEIEIVAKGKRDLLVPTADGVREPQNRRVQIVYSGGANS